MFGRKKLPGLRQMLHEMAQPPEPDDEPKLRDPEDIDREIAEEEAETKDPDEDLVVDPIAEGSERAEEELREAEAVYRDLITGCIFLCAVLLLGMLVARPALRYAAGVAIGCGVAVYLLVHMYRSIGWELSMEPEQAMRYSRKRTVIRYVVVLLAAVAVMLGLGKTAGVGCLLAILTIKPAAYLQPFTAKIRRKMNLRR
ncbi:MAG: hypothetical protein J5645_05900 [Lachnospiraceae bacterium]|nr:hypothetical protein [Lachnospiraceae bacterium]